MVVHNYPSSGHDNKHFLVIYWTCSFWIQALLLQEGHFLSVGRWVFLQSVASTLKCFSLQHIWSKWSLIAHWRMHDIKCLQTWNNHVLSLLEIVCSGICIYHHVEQNWSSHHASEGVPLSFDHANCRSVRDYIYFIGTSVLCYCLLHENSCFPCTVEMKARLAAPCRRAQGFVSRHTSIHPSVFWDEYLWSCSIFS